LTTEEAHDEPVETETTKVIKGVKPDYFYEKEKKL
jgi:hypothetical protein